MRFPVLALALSLFFCVAPVRSQTVSYEPLPPGEPITTDPPSEPGHWRVMASPYSFHYSQDPEHRPVWMVGAEWQYPNNYLWGVTYFSNSFGQPSGFVYG